MSAPPFGGSPSGREHSLSLTVLLLESLAESPMFYLVPIEEAALQWIDLSTTLPVGNNSAPGSSNGMAPGVPPTPAPLI